MDHNQNYRRIKRRKFIHKTVLAVSGAAVIPTVFTSCNQNIDEPQPSFIPKGDYGFYEGVASFDPTQDKVLLWTRYTPAGNESSSPRILLEVAENSDFSRIVVSEMTETDAADDYTVHIDVGNLKSNTKYYYRFKNEKTGAESVPGETKTLPSSGEADQIRFAFTSCANFEKGYFNVYGAISESDADFVVHLGDYIYEGSIGQDAIFDNKRIHKPPHEILTLADYRDRYRQYRRDEQLRELHRLKPFICIWDDHEFSNNTYKNGADGHGNSDGDFFVRKSNALQVWHEYLFARSGNKEKIYRKFDLGGFANLLMLDTRIIGRDKQLDYSDYITGENFDEESFKKDWKMSNRSILGKEQFNWLNNEIKTDIKKRQILGNQVLMAKHLFPAELIPIIHRYRTSGKFEKDQQTEYIKLVEELIDIKSKIEQGEYVSDDDRKRVANVLPYNLDSWDGYPAEREALFESFRGNKIISLAGASHNAWHAELTNDKSEKTGVEFATSSVTSSGLDGIFGSDPLISELIKQANIALIDDVKYLDAYRRGFVEIKLTEVDLIADWKFVRTISEIDTEAVSENQVSEV